MWLAGTVERFTTLPSNRTPAMAIYARSAQGNGGSYVIVKKEKLPTGFERRTPDWLRQEAEKRGLRAGKRIRIEGIRTDGLEYSKPVTRRGKVTGLYPYIFTCECGGVTESFRYNQLVGNEIGERVKLDG